MFGMKKNFICRATLPTLSEGFRTKFVSTLAQLYQVLGSWNFGSWRLLSQLGTPHTNNLENYEFLGYSLKKGLLKPCLLNPNEQVLWPEIGSILFLGIDLKQIHPKMKFLEHNLDSKFPLWDAVERAKSRFIFSFFQQISSYIKIWGHFCLVIRGKKQNCILRHCYFAIPNTSYIPFK
jgi:hypothetical protein